MSTDLSVPKTILAQLGGQRFIAMTGSRDFLGSERSLTFRLGARAKDSITHVRVVLDPSDTYSVSFLCARNMEPLRVVSEHNDVYAEALEDLFRRSTGLATRL
jgi:hypothetical protein